MDSPTNPLDPRNYSVEAAMLDGVPVRIRAIRPDDKDRLHDHFKSLSGQSIYYRFMGFRRDLTPRELQLFTELDFVNHVGLAATLTENGRERIIGVGRYIRGTQPDRAEVAFAITDGYQGHGIGTLLLHHLALIADAADIAEFEADVLGDNRQMLEVFGHSGFATTSIASGVVHLHASTTKLLRK